MKMLSPAPPETHFIPALWPIPTHQPGVPHHMTATDWEKEGLIQGRDQTMARMQTASRQRNTLRGTSYPPSSTHMSSKTAKTS